MYFAGLPVMYPIKPSDSVVCTDASGGIVGWLTQGNEYIVEWVRGADIKLIGNNYTSKLWRFKLKEPNENHNKP